MYRITGRTARWLSSPNHIFALSSTFFFQSRSLEFIHDTQQDPTHVALSYDSCLVCPHSLYVASKKLKRMISHFFSDIVVFGVEHAMYTMMGFKKQHFVKNMVQVQ